MKVSVIIPAWGSTPYLDEATASVRVQTHGDVELIIAAPPAGHESALLAREAGVAKATGEWITFLDADDTLEPVAIERLLAAADAQTDMVVSGLVRGNVKRLWGADVWATGPSDVFNCMCAKLFRRELLGGVVRDERVSLGEDLLVSAQLLHRARKISVVPDAFYHYRENPASLTHRLDGRKRVTDLLRVGELLRRELSEPQYRDFHDRVTRDAMLLWCRYRLCDRDLWRQLRAQLVGGVTADPRHGLVKKGALYLAHCLFD